MEMDVIGSFIVSSSCLSKPANRFDALDSLGTPSFQGRQRLAARRIPTPQLSHQLLTTPSSTTEPAFHTTQHRTLPITIPDTPPTAVLDVARPVTVPIAVVPLGAVEVHVVDR